MTAYVDKYIQVPERLTNKCNPIFIDYPIWLNTATWLDLKHEYERTLAHCNKKLDLIKNLTPNKK